MTLVETDLEGPVARIVLNDPPRRNALGHDMFDAFEAALSSLLDDHEMRAAMGERARAFVETWVSPAGVATAYGRLFAELNP